MSTRNRRQEEPDAIHHVFDRGTGRQIVFVDDEDRAMFLSRLETVVKRRGWQLLAYCLLGNHYHLVVETPAPDLGAGMRDLNAFYARVFNRRHAREDHVFRSPFGSRRVLTQDYFAHLLRYVAFNPVKAGLCADPAAWRWSSHGRLLRGAAGPLIAAQRVTELLGAGYSRLFDDEPPRDPWSADRPVPAVAELLRVYPEDRALLEARWTYGYTVAEIAAATAFGSTWISERTNRRRPEALPWGSACAGARAKGRSGGD